MTITVAQLIEKLQALPNPNAKVLVFAHEDFNTMRGITLRHENEDEKHEMYCKGYSFREYHEEFPELDYVVLHDEI